MSTDRITRGAAIASTLAHGALIGFAFWGTGGAPAQPAAPIPPTVEPPPPPATELVLEPEALAPPERPAELPALGASGLPTLPGLPITTAGPTDLPELHDSAGADRSAPAYRAEDLPSSAGRDDALASELRAKHASQSLTLEQEMRRDAVNQIHGRLVARLRTDRDWRSLARRMTNGDIVLQVEVDARCQITRAIMLRGTGLDELDRRITGWLENGSFGLPPIPVNHPLFALVSLR